MKENSGAMTYDLYASLGLVVHTMVQFGSKRAQAAENILFSGYKLIICRIRRVVMVRSRRSVRSWFRRNVYESRWDTERNLKELSGKERWNHINDTVREVHLEEQHEH